jgi:hypothetical protein
MQQSRRNKKKREARQRDKLSPAQQSVQRWLKWRERAPPSPTAEESAKNWMAFREAQKRAEASQTRR